MLAFSIVELSETLQKLEYYLLSNQIKVFVFL